MASAFFDDVTLAYHTLVNPDKRAEYDEYLESHIGLAGYQRKFYGKEYDNDEDA